MKNISLSKAFALVPVVLSSVAAVAEDWVVPLGTPVEDRTVTESVTYNNITTSEKIIIKNGAKLSTDSGSDKVYFTVAADAVAGSDDIVDVARIEAGSMLAPDLFQNNNAKPARIVFAGAGAEVADNRTHWDLHMFTKGPVILQDETGAGIRVAQEVGSSFGATGHYLNSTDVSVRLLGAGDVTFYRSYGSANGRQPWTFSNGLSVETSGAILFYCAGGGGTFYLNGDNMIADTVTGVTVQGKTTASDEGSACYLEIAANRTVRTKNLTANNTTRGRVLGAGTIEMGANDSNGTFDAIVRGNTLTLNKIDTGTLTVGGSVTNIPVLNVAGGTVKISHVFPIGTLTVAEGAELLVDGVTLTFPADTVDAASLERITCINGAQVIVSSSLPDAGKVELRNAVPDNSGIECVINGAGTAVIFDDTCPSAMLHANGAKVVFSAYGMTDRFLRLTFYRTWGWLNYDGVRRPPSYLRLVEFAFYDPDGTRIFSSDSTMYDVAAIASGSIAPSELTGVSSMAQAGTVFDTSGGVTHESMTGQFNHKYSGWYPYFMTYKLDDEAYAAGNFERFYFHSRDTDPRIHGYNMASLPGTGLPRTWTIEASPDGTDGSWYVVSKMVDFRNGFFRDEGWMNGVRYEGTGTADQGLHTVFTNYVAAGVSPNANAISVEVENGATIDFANVTGGQSINRIVYDLETGGGTVNAARIDKNGVIELSDDPASERINIKLTNAQDADNISNWAVMVNGKVLSVKLKVLADGTVVVLKRGLVITVR